MTAQSTEGPLVLRTPTDARWLPLALEHFDEVLVDHAHCEKKAAAQALSLLQAYPALPGLAIQMAQLAREESGHLTRVLRVLEERGLSLTRDLGDPYVQKLQECIRAPAPFRRVDRLLVSAIVEARSCERLALLADGLSDPGLRRLYAELAQSEHGHQALFFRLAVAASDPHSAAERLAVLLDFEAEILTRIEIRPAIH
jgi:tRNA-(ms[2]io[6]A)-hydroxylase